MSARHFLPPAYIYPEVDAADNLKESPCSMGPEHLRKKCLTRIAHWQRLQHALQGLDFRAAKRQQVKGARLTTPCSLTRCETCRRQATESNTAIESNLSEEGMILQVILCKQPSGGPNTKIQQDLPVSRRSCLSLRVPVLQGTKNSFAQWQQQLHHGRGGPATVQRAACTSATFSRDTGLQPAVNCS